MADERAQPQFNAELQAAVAESGGRELGSGYQASVRLHHTRLGPIVVKTPHGGALRTMWRYLLRREREVYACVAGIPGIPRCFGLLRGGELALEYIAGPSLREQEGQLGDREAFYARLLVTLRAMHAAGVAHGDLKRKDNVIVGGGEVPYLIDFGVAVRRSPTSALWNRLVFAPLAQMDVNAWVKLKYGRRLDPETDAGLLSAADAAAYRPLWIERLARSVRVPWQTLTLRRARQRWRARRNPPG